MSTAQMPELNKAHLEFFGFGQRELTPDWAVGAFLDLYTAKPHPNGTRPSIFPVLRLIGDKIDLDKVSLDISGGLLIASSQDQEDDQQIFEWVILPKTSGSLKVRYDGHDDQASTFSWVFTGEGSYLIFDYDGNPVDVSDVPLGLYREVISEHKLEVRAQIRRTMELLQNENDHQARMDLLHLVLQLQEDLMNEPGC